MFKLNPSEIRLARDMLRGQIEAYSKGEINMTNKELSDAMYEVAFADGYLAAMQDQKEEELRHAQ